MICEQEEINVWNGLGYVLLLHSMCKVNVENVNHSTLFIVILLLYPSLVSTASYSRVNNN